MTNTKNTENKSSWAIWLVFGLVVVYAVLYLQQQKRDSDAEDFYRTMGARIECRNEAKMENNREINCELLGTKGYDMHTEHYFRQYQKHNPLKP